MTSPSAPSSVRQLTPLDRLVINLDHGFRTVFGKPLTTARPDPADAEAEAELGTAERELQGLASFAML